MQQFARLQDIKYVDEHSQILVYGFLRALALRLNTSPHMVPQLIANLCSIYYYQASFFALTISGSNEEALRYSDDKRHASIVETCWGSCFGNVLIPSTSHIVCKWHIRVGVSNEAGHKISYANELVLGLVGKTSDKFLDVFDLEFPTLTFVGNGRGKVWGNTKKSKEGYTARHDLDKSYASEPKLQWKADDVIGIKLDLQKNCVAFDVNNGPEITTHIIGEKSVASDIFYRLVISMNYDNQCVDLIGFQHM
mmetsp:Transcript_51885/g.85907  ORF Transcript_51885/g.85907 Transcript_51885/m.85907 type:complete len:251 (+) Transcript_51885:34-786(+)